MNQSSNIVVWENRANLPAVVDSNGLFAYFEKIKKFPVLSDEEEQSLLVEFKQNGNLQAAQKLITSHLRLAAKVALSFRHYGLALADLISEANIGLMQAIKKFDPDKGFRLATYAVWWIKAAVSEFVLKSWSLVKIGTVSTQKRLFYNLHKIKAKLGLYHETSLNNESAEKIAKMLNVNTKDVIEMEQRLSGDSSLNVTLSGDTFTNRQDMLTDNTDTVEEMLGKQEDLDIKRKMLYQAMEQLKDREKIIVQERFLSDSPATLEDLGVRFGISRERVRQIESKAFEKIKAAVQLSARKLAIE